MLTLESELRELVQRFNEAKIEYALCGGMAVALHGHPRFTRDIHFWSIPNRSTEQKRLLRQLVFLTNQVEFRSPTLMFIVFSRTKVLNTESSTCWYQKDWTQSHGPSANGLTGTDFPFVPYREKV